MNDFHVDEIGEFINRGKDEKQNPDIMDVIYSLGRDAQNEEEYDYAFRTLLEILDGGMDRVRAYCILGFSLQAVFCSRLDRDIVEPIILAENSYL